MDGYSSAFIFRKYLAEHFNIKPTKVVGIQPRDVQEEFFTFEPTDVVVDLPEPKTKVAVWFDHHSSNKPEEEKENHFWKQTPSCASFLIDYAQEQGIDLPEDVVAFKKVIDTMDDAQFTEQEIKESLYLPAELNTDLQKAQAVYAVIDTKDRFLNQLFLQKLVFHEGVTPIDVGMNKDIFYEARLMAYDSWRTEVDTYLEYDEATKTVIQDDRKGRARGKADHFYTSVKFPDSAYNLLIKPLDEETILVRIGSNIFHKDRCKTDIGKLCKEVGTKFGEGSGGGHFGVGGCTINAGKEDEAKAFILETLKE